jgi:hypothetical protein
MSDYSHRRWIAHYLNRARMARIEMAAMLRKFRETGSTGLLPQIADIRNEFDHYMSGAQASRGWAIEFDEYRYA